VEQDASKTSVPSAREPAASVSSTAAGPDRSQSSQAVEHPRNHSPSLFGQGGRHAAFAFLGAQEAEDDLDEDERTGTVWDRTRQVWVTQLTQEEDEEDGGTAPDHHSNGAPVKAKEVVPSRRNAVLPEVRAATAPRPQGRPFGPLKASARAPVEAPSQPLGTAEEVQEGRGEEEKVAANDDDDDDGDDGDDGVVDDDEDDDVMTTSEEELDDDEEVDGAGVAEEALAAKAREGSARQGDGGSETIAAHQSQSACKLASETIAARPVDGEWAGAGVGAGAGAGFVWRPVVPRGAASAAVASVRANQQEQRDRLLARLFPHESSADAPASRSAIPRPRKAQTLSRRRGALEPPLALRVAAPEPAPGEADLRDVDDDDAQRKLPISSSATIPPESMIPASILVGGEPARIAKREARWRAEAHTRLASQTVHPLASTPALERIDADSEPQRPDPRASADELYFEDDAS
jgi:hypothetical protein